MLHQQNQSTCSVISGYIFVDFNSQRMKLKEFYRGREDKISDCDYDRREIWKNIKRIKYLGEDEPFCLRCLTGEFINYKLCLE